MRGISAFGAARTQNADDASECFLAASSKCIANGCAIFGNPIASELEEIIHPMHIHLGTNKETASHIQANASGKMRLEVVRALHVIVSSRTPSKSVAGAFDLHKTEDLRLPGPLEIPARSWRS